MAVATTPAPSPVLSASPPLLTYEAYLDETEQLEQYSYEIIDGERIFMAGARWMHQRIVGNVYELLRRFEREAHSGMALLAPFDVVIRRAPLRTRQPDALFISNERLAEAGDVREGDEPLTIRPELVIEVLSPSDTPRTLRAKLADLAAVGSREAWLVSAEAETVQVLCLDTHDAPETVAVYAYGQTFSSFAFPGLTVAVADLFAE